MNKKRIASLMTTLFMLFNILISGTVSANSGAMEIATIFDDAFRAGTDSGWNCSFNVETNAANVKVGSASLKFSDQNGSWGQRFWTFSKPITSVLESDKNNTALTFWIKNLNGANGAKFMIVTNSADNKQTEIELNNFVPEDKRNDWYFVKIPFNQINEFTNDPNGVKTKWNDICGIGMKQGGKGDVYFDDMKIVQGELEEEGTLLTQSAGIYETIFTETVSKTQLQTWEPNKLTLATGVAIDGGNCILGSFAPKGWQGGAVELPKISKIDQSNLDKMALQFDMFTDSKIPFYIGIQGSSMGKTIKSELNVFDYLNTLGEMKTVTIPLSDFSVVGSYYDNQTQSNQQIRFPFERIKAISLSADTNSISTNYDFYLDNIKIISYKNDSVSSAPISLIESEYNKQTQNFTDISLGNAKNKSYEQIGINIGEGTKNYLNIPFNMTNNQTISSVCVKSNASLNIAVNQTAKGIYFLHTAKMKKSDLTLGNYKINYSDGTNYNINIQNKVNISDIDSTFHSDYGKTAYSDANGKSISIFAFANPYPTKTITSIDVSAVGDNEICVLGAKITDNGPYTIVSEKNPLANPDMSDWFVYDVTNPQKLVGTPLDMSWNMEKPAGKNGFVTQNGEKMYFENGKEAKLLGVNITAEANFSSKEDADKLVAKIVTSGYNLVRFHHMDSNWVKPNIFGDGSQTLKLDATQLDKFEYLWSELKKNGVYLYVDGVVGRTFVQNEVANYTKITPGAKSSSYLLDDVKQRNKEYFNQLFTHLNPYTQTSLATDPALVMVDLHNEDSLLWEPTLAWNWEGIRDTLQTKFNVWLKAKYATSADLITAWGSLDSGENYGQNVKLWHDYLKRGYTQKRIEDSREFLYETQTNYYKEMTAYCKNTLLMKCMITGSNAPDSKNALDLHSNATGSDFVDQHNYYNHPVWGDWNYQAGTELKNAFTSMVTDTNNSLITYFANRDIYGVPFVQSEWNVCTPNQYVGEGPLLMNAYGTMHNWTPIKYNLLQGKVPTNNQISDVFSSYTQPTVTAIQTATAPLFYRQDVKVATSGYYANVTKAQALDPNFAPQIPHGAQFIGKTGIVFDDLAKSEPTTAINNQTILEKTQNANGEFISMAKDMRLNEKTGLFEVNTDNTQAYTGFNNGEVNLNDVSFNITNPHSTIVLTSIADGSIRNSAKLLLSATGNARNYGSKFSPEGSIILNSGGAPILAEPIKGIVKLKTKDDYKVYPLTADGQRKAPLATSRDADGNLVITLGAESQTLNYELEKSNDVVADRIANAVYPQWAMKSNINTSGDTDVKRDIHKDGKLVNIVTPMGKAEEKNGTVVLSPDPGNGTKIKFNDGTLDLSNKQNYTLLFKIKDINAANGQTVKPAIIMSTKVPGGNEAYVSNPGFIDVSSLPKDSEGYRTVAVKLGELRQEGRVWSEDTTLGIADPEMTDAKFRLVEGDFSKVSGIGFLANSWRQDGSHGTHWYGATIKDAMIVENYKAPSVLTAEITDKDGIIIDDNNNAPVDGQIIFKLDGKMATDAINTQTVQLLDGTTVVKGTKIVAIANNAYKLTTVAKLKGSTNYTLKILKGVKNIAQLPLAQDVTFNFKTQYYLEEDPEFVRNLFANNALVGTASVSGNKSEQDICEIINVQNPIKPYYQKYISVKNGALGKYPSIKFSSDNAVLDMSGKTFVTFKIKDIDNSSKNTKIRPSIIYKDGSIEDYLLSTNVIDISTYPKDKDGFTNVTISLSDFNTTSVNSKAGDLSKCIGLSFVLDDTQNTWMSINLADVGFVKNAKPVSSVTGTYYSYFEQEKPSNLVDVDATATITFNAEMKPYAVAEYVEITDGTNIIPFSVQQINTKTYKLIPTVDLLAATKYTINVKDGIETVSNSQLVTPLMCQFTTGTPLLAKPINIKSSPNATGIKLVWDKVENATSYNIYKNGVKIQTLNTNECIDKEVLVDGTTYNYQVKALSETQKTTSFKSENFVVSQKALPLIANLKTVNVNSNVIKLSWDNVTVPGILGYYVFKNDVLVTKAPITNNYFIDENVKPNTKYSYTVVTTDGVILSQKSLLEVTTKPSDSFFVDLLKQGLPTGTTVSKSSDGSGFETGVTDGTQKTMSMDYWNNGSIKITLDKAVSLTKEQVSNSGIYLKLRGVSAAGKNYEPLRFSLLSKNQTVENPFYISTFEMNGDAFVVDTTYREYFIPFDALGNKGIKDGKVVDFDWNDVSGLLMAVDSWKGTKVNISDIKIMSKGAKVNDVDYFSADGNRIVKNSLSVCDVKKITVKFDQALDIGTVDGINIYDSNNNLITSVKDYNSNILTFELATLLGADQKYTIKFNNTVLTTPKLGIISNPAGENPTHDQIKFRNISKTQTATQPIRSKNIVFGTFANLQGVTYNENYVLNQDKIKTSNLINVSGVMGGVNISNFDTTVKNATLVIAVYEDVAGVLKLKEIRENNITILANQEDQTFETQQINLVGITNPVVKVFVWDTLSGLSPKMEQKAIR